MTEPRFKVHPEHIAIVAALNENLQSPGAVCHDLLKLIGEHVDSKAAFTASSLPGLATVDPKWEGAKRTRRTSLQLRSIIDDEMLMQIPDDAGDILVDDWSNEVADWRVSYDAAAEVRSHEPTLVVAITTHVFMTDYEREGHLDVGVFGMQPQHRQAMVFMQDVIEIIDQLDCRYAFVDLATNDEIHAGAYYGPALEPAPLRWDRFVNRWRWEMLFERGEHENRVRNVYFGNYLGKKLKNKLLAARPDLVDRFKAHKTGDVIYHSVRETPSGALYFQLDESLMNISQIQIVDPSDTAAEMAAWLMEEFRTAGIL